MGFRVQGSGFRVYRQKHTHTFPVESLGFIEVRLVLAQDPVGFRVVGLGFGVSDLGSGFRLHGLGFGVSDLGFRV